MKTERSYSEQWDEMVFENRNKDYGAYLLRRFYPKNVFKGLIITTSAVILFLITPLILSWFEGEEIPDIMKVQRLAVHTELMPPPAIQVKPPAKIETATTVKPIEKLLPPKVVTEEVPDELPPVEEVKAKPEQKEDENAKVGSLTGDENGEGDDPTVYDETEQMPHFIGGDRALQQFLANNVRYPLSAMQRRLSGTVYVSFIVNMDGTISDVKTIRGFFGDCDKEAERLVRSMPLWEPGRQAGKPKKVRFSIPIKFKFGA